MPSFRRSSASFLLLLLLFAFASTLVESTSSDILDLRSELSPAVVRRIDNFKRIVEHVRTSDDFQPFKISLLLFKTKSIELDFLLEYIASQNIPLYRLAVTDYVSKYAWRTEASLTWILPIDDVHDLLAFAYLQEDLWQPRNQYLIVYAGKARRSYKSWLRIFHRQWTKFNVYRILVVSINDDFRCFLGYRPFDVTAYGFGKLRRSCFDDGASTNEDTRRLPDDVNNRPVASVSVSVTFSSLSRNASLFQKFDRVNGYPIKVTVFPSMMMYIDPDENGTDRFTRLDADVMTLLERGMRANFVVDVFRKSRNEDPFRRSLKSINDRESDMVVTSFFVKSYDDSFDYEFTVTVNEDKLCFVAPTRGYLPKMYMPFLPFSDEFWLVLAVYDFLATIFWVVLTYLSTTFRTDQPIVLPLQKTPPITSKNSFFVLKTNFPFVPNRIVPPALPPSPPPPPEIHPRVVATTELLLLLCYPFEKARTTAQRSFLCGALFFGLIVGGLYHSCLVSTLGKPLRYPELNTIEEVADSNYTVVTKYANLKTSTFVENELLDVRLKNKIRVLDTKIPTNYFVAYDRTVIALGRFASVKLENDSVYYDDYGNKLIHVVEDCPATYALSYVVRRHSPYLERINTLLLRMQEFGLVQLWYRDMTRPLLIEEERRKVASNERKAKLTLEHYSLTFLGLFLGLIGCFLVFLAEIYYARCAGSR